MPIDTSVPESPGWWFKRLLTELGKRQDRLDRLDSYFCGEPPLPEGASGLREAYRQFQRKSRSNFAELVVESVRERMMPVGFRTGGDSDDLGDKEAWRIWQANSLDADSALVDRATLSMGDSYVIVGGVDPSINAPLITPEDPRQVITACDPARRRVTTAALKIFHSDVDSADRAYLYLPGFVLRASRSRAAGAAQEYSLGSWDWVDVQRTPFPVVPVVRFPNRMSLSGHTMGEFEDCTDVLDRINFMVLQRLVIAAVQAFRQRALKGELPANDVNGDPIDYSGMFRADPGALWQLPEGVDMWESTPIDLGPILSAVRHDIQDLAAITRTPLFYLTPDAANGSAEGASLAREGLVFKTQDRIKERSESWEQVMSLAFLFAGDPDRASRADMEVLWAPAERFSLAERYDAASKAQAAGVPWETVMRDVLQFTPQQIERMQSQRSADALLAPQPVISVGAA